MCEVGLVWVSHLSGEADHSAPVWRLKGQGDLTHMPPSSARPLGVKLWDLDPD